MSKEAVAEYIKIYYEEFYRRHGNHFGAAMPATFADHEGDYGAKLPWTPRLFETFRRKTGYSLQPKLPALTYDIGANTEKVRCDLLDTISELYCNNFFQQVTDWCQRHKIEHSGHVFEESLFFGPAQQGDFFRILRSMSNPGCDTLEEWGRQSIWLKENASVADFERRHVVCENQGVQGGSSYLSPQRMRRVSNCLGAWNVGEFIPHAFDYDLSRINFPPDWFRSQPYLPWFRAYADQMRRLSFMNRESHQIAEILLYYPQVSVWGQSATAFRTEDIDEIEKSSFWTSDAAETNEQYGELKLRLSEERLDYQVADHYYLDRSQVEGNRLRLSDSRFQTLILPPMSTIRRSSAERVRNFFSAGGTVIAHRRLPLHSVESGRKDPSLMKIWEETFDSRPTLQPFRLKTNAAGGRAYFVPRGVPDVLAALRQFVDPDVAVTEGPDGYLYVLHKIKANTHFYWVVNDTAQSRTNMLALRTLGRPERWDAENSQRSPLFYQTLTDRTLVRLTLGPWDATYVVFDASGSPQPMALTATNLDDFHIVSATQEEVIVYGKSLIRQNGLSVTLAHGQQQYHGLYQPAGLKPLDITGEWKVTVQASEIAQPYALALDDSTGRGIDEGWHSPSSDQRAWQPLWLSAMNAAFRQWNVLGPFPNPQDRLEPSHPPEEIIDYDATYLGDENMLLRWQQIDAADYHLRPGQSGWNIGTMKITGGPYADSSFAVEYGEPLRLSPLFGAIYVQTNVYSPEETDAVLVLATPNPRAVLLNGVNVHSRWLRPPYSQLTDGFASLLPVRLKSGWNSLLLKFLHNPENPRPANFSCRVQHPNGAMLEGVLCSSRTFLPQENPASGYRWLKFGVPPLAGSLKVPALKHPWLAFVDSAQVSPTSEIPLPHESKSVVLRVAASEQLTTPFAFSVISASLPLGSWNRPGLEHFSGQMSYEKTVVVPSHLLAERLLLDCGELGVVAEAWINGQPAGSRAWAPFVFDLTDHVHAGANHLKVLVANTEANARAVGQSKSIAKDIDWNGWHGPARLVPFVSREIRLSRKA